VEDADQERTQGLRSPQTRRGTGLRFIKQALGFRQFLLRGLEKAGAEWELVNLAYNLRRLHASGRYRPAMAI
jgi:hypothetical protein